jgi:hypothetical protein
MVPFISLVSIPKHVVGITRHVVTTISAFSFSMLLLDRILTHIVNHISNTSYHLRYLYCQVGYVFSAKPNLITCVRYIFLSVGTIATMKKYPEVEEKHSRHLQISVQKPVEDRGGGGRSNASPSLTTTLFTP